MRHFQKTIPALKLPQGSAEVFVVTVLTFNLVSAQFCFPHIFKVLFQRLLPNKPSCANLYFRKIDLQKCSLDISCVYLAKQYLAICHESMHQEPKFLILKKKKKIPQPLPDFHPTFFLSSFLLP